MNYAKILGKSTYQISWIFTYNKEWYQGYHGTKSSLGGQVAFNRLVDKSLH